MRAPGADSVCSENNGSFLNVYSRLLFFLVEDVQIASIHSVERSILGFHSREKAEAKMETF